MARDIDVLWPLGGVNDDSGHRNQPEGTTREAQNVRNIDPATGRSRGAMRPGLSKFVPVAIDPDNRVKEVTSIIFDEANFDFSKVDQDGETLEFSVNPPIGGVPICFDVDSVGSTYAIDGAYDNTNNPDLDVGFQQLVTDGRSFSKFSPQGQLLQTVAPTGLLPGQFLRELHVSKEITDPFAVYVGISEGPCIPGEPRGRIFRFVPDASGDNLFELWRLDTDLVQGIRQKGFLLYTVQQNPESRKGFLRIYDALTSSAPTLAAEREIAFPVNDVDVDSMMNVFTTHEPALTFADDQRGNLGFDLTRPCIDWTPEKDLEMFDVRCWAHFEARSLVDDNLQDGDEIQVWRNEAPNSPASDLRKDVNFSAPTLKLNAFGNSTVDFPAVKFDPGDIGTSAIFPSTDQDAQLLRSEPNSGLADDGSQRTTLPAYTGSEYAMFIVLQPDVDQQPDTAGANDIKNHNVFNQGPVFSQVNDLGDGDIIGGTGSTQHALVTHRTPSDTVTVENGADQLFSAGDISWINDTTGTGDMASGAGDQPLSPVTVGNQNPEGFLPTGKSRFCLITLINTTDANGLNQKSSIRFNGEPLDQFTSTVFTTANFFTFFGAEFVPNLPALGIIGGAYSGLIYEIYVFRDWKKSGTPQPVFDHKNYPQALFQAGNQTELQQMEGFLMHKYGKAQRLDNEPGGGSLNFPHPYFRQPNFHPTDPANHPLNYGCPRSPVLAFDNDRSISPEYEQTLPYPLLTKFSMGDLKAIWTMYDSGVGYGVHLSELVDEDIIDTTENPNGRIFTMGPRITDTSPSNELNANLRGIFDDVDAALAPNFDADTAGKAWFQQVALEPGTDLTMRYPRMDSDKFGNGYFPIHTDDTTQQKLCQINREAGAPTTLDFQQNLAITSNGVFGEINDFFCARTHPILSFDRLDETTQEQQISIASSLYLSSEKIASLASNSSLHRLLLVNAASGVDVVMRSITNLAVTAGNISKFSSTLVQVTDGGLGILEAGADYVASAILFRKVFFTSGPKYAVYDAIEDVTTDYLANGVNAVPPNNQLIASWRGAIMLARPPEDPSVWFLSERGDPFGWDFAPATFSVTQASSALTSRAGLVPDSINGIVPWTDDLLLFLCDRAVYRLTGDPNAGGQMDQIRDVSGGSFGKAWAKDRDNRLYYFDSQGGVVMIPNPGSPEVRLSRDRIERRFRDIDLGNNRIRMEWDTLNEGLHVLVVPRADATTNQTHYFWDQKNDAWWLDKYLDGSTAGANQPTALYLFDADDPDDRQMVLGCQDGFIRKFDNSADDDDGLNIDSRVLWGPFFAREAGGSRMRDLMMTRFIAELASDLNGVNFEVFATDTADRPTRGDVGSGVLGTVVFNASEVRRGTLSPGLNSARLVRPRGRYIWIRFRSRDRWAFEGLNVGLRLAGRQRMHRI